MAAGREKRAAVAGVWAESLMELASAAGREDELQDELQGLVALLDRDPRFEALLATPLVDQEAKRRILEESFRGRASDLLVDALEVMRRKGRLDLVRDTVLAFHQQWLARRGRVEARVTTASPLSPELRRALAAAVTRRTGRETILVERLDPELIGGLVVAIGDEKFDDSVASELGRIERELLGRAARELAAGSTYVTEISSSTPQGDVSP
jgi:F-type H+-transporting ATPase subunit delta